MPYYNEFIYDYRPPIKYIYDEWDPIDIIYTADKYIPIKNDDVEEDIFPELEEKIDDILRSLHPIRVLVFKMYYNIGEFKDIKTYAELSQEFNVPRTTLTRWNLKTLEYVKKRIRKDVRFINYFTN